MASKYCCMSLMEPRGELKKRSARLSGRKKDLIERLEAYDRNANFGRPDSPVNAEFSMKLPEAMDYRDLNTDTKFASVKMSDITFYLDKFDKKLDQTPLNLYKERYLCYTRSHYDEDRTLFYVKSACRAEMKKSIVYTVDVIILPNGEIVEAQCECGAGMGPNAHCKHVSTVIYALHMFSKNGSIVVENSCTEKLQSFHKVKKHTGSPVKACDLELPGADESTNVRFDPRPERFRNTDWYPSYFRNTCLNFPGISKMPIFQLFEPACVRSFCHDHDYLEKTHEDMFLERFEVQNISSDVISSVELRTRGQADSEAWKEERKKRVQSSNFGRICKATSKTDLNKLAKNLIDPQQFKTDATKHGVKYEKEAISHYERVRKCKVKKCGIYVSKTMPFLGCSPDGVVSDSIVIEVKCPYTAKNKLISPETVPYLKQGEIYLELDTNHNYYYQVQGQLFCTGLTHCDFVVYTLVDIRCLRIERDANFISEMLEKLLEFYNKHFKEALLHEYFYRPLEY